MQVDALTSKIHRLPERQRREVADFVDFLASRIAGGGQDRLQADWHDEDFVNMSVTQAMRGMGEEPDIYTDKDLKERWL